MTVPFPSVPNTIRLPFAYAEFDPTGASEGPAIMPYTVLLVGQMLPAGKAAAYSVQRPMTAAQGIEFFGRGSMLAEMTAAYLNANPTTRMLAIAAPDDDAGTAATGVLSVSGTVLASAPVCLYVGGVLARAATTIGLAAADVAAGIATAINANPDLPVTATDSAGSVTLTAKHKGECGNDIDIRLGYYGEPLPGGLQITVTAMSGGNGNLDPAPIIAAMASDQYHVIAWPWTDTMTLNALRDELADRWGPLRQIDGQAVVVKRGSFGQVTTFAGGRNDKHLTVLPSQNSPTSPWADAAASAGVIAYYGQNDPARGFNTLLIPGVLAPSTTDLWPDFPEKNQGLFEGVSTRYVAPDGTVRFSKLITTHRLNPLGAEDRAFLSLNSPLTLSYLRYDWNNYLRLKYPRHKLAGDADAKRYGPAQPVMTPNLGRAEAIARFLDVWLPMGLVEGSEQFKKDIICERNAANENRLDWLLRPDLMNQFEVAGTLFRHIV